HTRSTRDWSSDVCSSDLEFDPLHPLRVAVLGPKTANADAFLEAVDKADAAIRWLSSNVDLVAIGHLEMFLPHDVDLDLLDEARRSEERRVGKERRARGRV